MKLTDEQILDIFKTCKVQELGVFEEDDDCGSWEDFCDGIQVPEGWTFDIEHGASKLVILLYKQGEEPVAIKIPMDGMWHDKYNEDDDWVETVFEQFSGAGRIFDADERWDYCATEVDIYECAKAENLEHMFAETRLIGRVNNRPIYVQQFVNETFYDAKEREISENSKEIAKSINNNYKLPTEWVALAIDWFGTDNVKRFLDFLQEYEIGDLHGGNVGYIGGRPILIDYSDFYH